jgi:hypothetical protein
MAKAIKCLLSKCEVLRSNLQCCPSFLKNEELKMKKLLNIS